MKIRFIKISSENVRRKERNLIFRERADFCFSRIYAKGEKVSPSCSPREIPGWRAFSPLSSYRRSEREENLNFRKMSLRKKKHPSSRKCGVCWVDTQATQTRDVFLPHPLRRRVHQQKTERALSNYLAITCKFIHSKRV